MPANKLKRARMPKDWAPPPKKLRLHIENVASMALVYQIIPERYAAAAQRHKQLARRIDATVAADPKGFDKAIADADILVGWRFDRENLAKRAPNLKWIHMTGAGIEHVLPLDWLPPGAVLTNNRGVHAPKARQFAMTALLMLNERIPELITEQRKARWSRLFATAIEGKTALIISVGMMGDAAARAAKSLGLHVIGIRRSGAPNRYVDEMFTPDRLDDLLPRADFVLVNAPLTAETEGMLGRRELDLMKSTAGLINMGRARVVDYKALSTKLRKGELSGAILDVFDPEPLPKTSPLWKVPNLIMTPHVSSDDNDNYAPLTIDLVFENIARWYAGKTLKNVVDPDLQY
ncbi:MAG: D-2-hydroxyacid dehydrogenase [Alphaproteobacteria bacterium]|nr:D-2-hydroxyacid dehydrogenase [Alphaproteobacteria bacterium]